MAPTAQVIRNKKGLKTECSEKAAIGALYGKLAKRIDSMKKGDVYMIDETWEGIDILKFQLILTLKRYAIIFIIFHS